MLAHLDPYTVHVTLVIVQVISLLLLYRVAYRPGRSMFVGLWCLALALIATATSLYLFDGSNTSGWSRPAANGLLIAGLAVVLKAVRALSGRRVTGWGAGAAALVAVAATLLDSPATNPRAGAWALFPLVTALVSASSWTMWSSGPSEADRLRRAIATTGWLVAAFSLGRCIIYVTIDPAHTAFETIFSPATTMLLLICMLVSASLGMTAINNQFETRELRRRAEHDGLTGALNRNEFLRRARPIVREMRGAHDAAFVVVMADLDHFKQVNDTHGHAVGDQVLTSFASTCREILRSSDLIARYGGEEFVFLLLGASERGATQILDQIRRRPLGDRADLPAVTASFGLAPGRPGMSLEDLVAAADAALYRAKNTGRDRIVSAG